MSRFGGQTRLGPNWGSRGPDAPWEGAQRCTFAKLLEIIAELLFSASYMKSHVCFAAAAGGGERADPGDPGHLQRAARLPRLLAALQHHGRRLFRR